ncbi:TonB-dependent receptor plug domain-containing protein [Cnuella takakiae]|nr:TonB-dependent receptor [Cnuella takakiae]OLY94806.1 TonB-dependent receptor [Cnuella takakiae]
MKKTTVVSLALLGTLTLQAQSQQVDLDPVTVTSSLNAIKSSRTGRNLVIIKGEQFAQLPVNSIDELLRYIPGVEVQARGPQGAQSDIVLRGGTFQQVLVVVDGLRLNDPNTGHFSSYIPIAPSEIERIEVLKGASSAIYGSDAVGGVIHIITKTFASRGERRQISGQIGVGEYGLVNGQAGGFYSNGKTSFGAGMISNNSNGQLQRGTRGYFHNNTVSVSAAQHINDNLQVGIRSSFDHRDFAAQNFYTTFASDTASETVSTFWNQASVNYQKNRGKLSANIGYKSVEDEYYFNPVSIPNNNKSKLFQAIAAYEHRIGENSYLTGGGQFQNRKIASNDRGNHTVKQAAGFLVLNQSIGEGFRFNPAIRVDWDERAGTELVPQMALSYRKGMVQLRGAAGKTIRHADFTERYNNYNKALVTRGSIGNPDLKAERSFSYELGADLYASNNLRVAATYFQRNHNDLIDFVTTPYSDMPRKTNIVPTGTYALARNVSEVTTRGFETDLVFQKALAPAQNLLLMAGLVWLDSQTDETRDMFYVRSHAKFMTNFNVRYAYKGFAVAANGIYKNRAPRKAAAINAEVTKEYFVLNLVAEAAVYRQQVRLFVQADNILNTRYSDLLGSVMPGTWVMGGVKVNWSK